jgi:hypothetical protein
VLSGDRLTTVAPEIPFEGVREDSPSVRLTAVSSTLVSLAIACSAKEEPAANGDAGAASAPEVLASDHTDTVTVLAVDDNNVYWVNEGRSGGVYQVGKSGGPVSTLYQGALGHVGSIGVDATSVYFPTGNAILAVSIGGGATRTLSAVPTAPGVTAAVAVESGRVYWHEVPPPGPTTAWSTLKSVSTNGDAPSQIELTNTDRLLPADTILGAGGVIYLGRLNNVVRVPLDGSPPSTIPLQVRNSLVTIAVSGSDLFYVRSDAIDSVPSGGGGSRDVAAVKSPFGLAVDESFVYTTTVLEGVLKIPKAGGTPRTIVVASAPVLVTDADYLYLAGDRIQRVHK